MAYLLAVPFAAFDGFAAVSGLRLLTEIAQIGGAWAFYFVLRRPFGAVPTCFGAFALLSASTLTALHMLPLPNHVSLALSLAALACLVPPASVTRRRCGALCVGALPWVMAHAALTALFLLVLALWLVRRERREIAMLLGLALVPSICIIGLYAAHGALPALVNTILRPPLDLLFESGPMVAAADSATVAHWPHWRGWGRFWAALIPLRLPASVSAWLANDPALLALALQCVFILAGAALLPRALRGGPPAALWRPVVFLCLPLAAGAALMVYVKPPFPPEYALDFAPFIGLCAALRPHRVWHGAAYASAVALLCIPIDPWHVPNPPSIWTRYCTTAVDAQLRTLPPGATVLDLAGACSGILSARKAPLHPPFTFTPQWLTHHQRPWVGRALDGDGSPDAATERLRRALSPKSTVVVVFADERLHAWLRDRGLHPWFRNAWRLEWQEAKQQADVQDPGVVEVWTRRLPNRHRQSLGF